MKKFKILVAVTMATLSVSANAASVTSRGGYEYDRNRLSDASVLNRSIEACRRGGIKQEVQERLAKFMGVPEANVRLEFCRRILTAYAKGAIPYEDYVQLAENHVMAPSISKALRSADASPLKSPGREQRSIVLPVSVKMDSGETFEGSTVASRGRGRFSVQSSRHSVKCFGTYDLKDRRPTVTLPVKCSDGRTGQAEVTRAPDLMSAWGRVKLSDGSTGRLAVGRVRN
ncbi:MULTISPECIES: hypothetical protein [unclassified Sinorhizobium]|uniref:hypothetical protein n=1 Tax=unclassified Sinorhizobium TaxID=2613772 RepID=UPI003524CEDB